MALATPRRAGWQGRGTRRRGRVMVRAAMGTRKARRIAVSLARSVLIVGAAVGGYGPRIDR